MASPPRSGVRGCILRAHGPLVITAVSVSAGLVQEHHGWRREASGDLPFVVATARAGLTTAPAHLMALDTP